MDTALYLICRVFLFCQNGRTGMGLSPEVAEEVRSRLFLLEEENASLKRAAELELPREVDALKHQVRSAQKRVA